MTLDIDNSKNWTIPVLVQVFCNFVDDQSCSHEYLPTLDPSLSRIEVCENSPNFQLDFATPATAMSYQFPTSDGDQYLCALIHYGEKRLEVDFDHSTNGVLNYVYDPDSNEWQNEVIRVSFGTKFALQDKCRL